MLHCWRRENETAAVGLTGFGQFRRTSDASDSPAADGARRAAEDARAVTINLWPMTDLEIEVLPVGLPRALRCRPGVYYVQHRAIEGDPRQGLQQDSPADQRIGNGDDRG